MSCEHSNKVASEASETLLLQDTLKYAQGFAIARSDDYVCVTVCHPDDEKKMYGKYYLCKNDTVKTPTDGARIQIPLNSIATASCTHFEFLQLLGEIEKITGICEPKRAYNPTIRRRATRGLVLDLGDSFNINYEKLLGLKPSALMVSGLEQHDENQVRIFRSGIPILYNNEWMEKTLLGRAEWIKFVAVFFDKSSKADSIFKQIETEYQKATLLAQHADIKPVIMAGTDFRGTWYVPGGKSYVAELYRNGGGKYVFENESTTASIPLSFEAALQNFSHADVWLWCSCNSLQELKAINEKHALFKAFQSGNVYSNTNRSTPTGGNDFWESAVARPDILLQDVIKALHPEWLPNHSLYYLKKIN
ncbi:MAG: ABC transporter substrate-binding protein [Bacteroidales bacterium]|nr:ABC transporter substrate-binding protein [Bacteroidales bacterium]